MTDPHTCRTCSKSDECHGTPGGSCPFWVRARNPATLTALLLVLCALGFAATVVGAWFHYRKPAPRFGAYFMTNQSGVHITNIRLTNSFYNAVFIGGTNDTKH